MMEWKVRLCAGVIYTILTSMYNEMMMQKHEYTETLKDFTKGSCICDSHPNIHGRPLFWTLVHKVNN